MVHSITAPTLFADLQEKLDLQWISGANDDSAGSLSPEDLTSRPAMAGFLNIIHPNRVQVLGREEVSFLEGLEKNEKSNTVSRILGSQPLVIVVGDALEPPPVIVTATSKNATALIRSDRPAHELVNYFQYYISKKLAQRQTLHGVFMEVFTIGVLFTGDPGSGKSELALELLNRGHRLIADDAPEFTLISPEIIDGTCPEALQDCLEVRGLGVLNVRHMFGDAAVKLNKFLRLIIHLEIPDGGSPENMDRLRGNTNSMDVLGLEIPSITLPVMAGRNLSVIAEAAVRDFMLKMKGFDAASEFIERHSRILQRQNRGFRNR